MANEGGDEARLDGVDVDGDADPQLGDDVTVEAALTEQQPCRAHRLSRISSHGPIAEARTAGDGSSWPSVDQPRWSPLGLHGSRRRLLLLDGVVGADLENSAELNAFPVATGRSINLLENFHFAPRSFCFVLFFYKDLPKYQLTL